MECAACCQAPAGHSGRDVSVLPRAPRFILRFDAITIQRSTGTAIDSEGDPTGGRPTVFEGRGTLGSVSATEQLVAAQRNTTVDKGLNVELGMDLLEGDWVTVKGSTYEVVAAEDRRLHRRALVRKL
jgi:hypothetical protein